MGALYSLNFLRPGGLGGAEAELITTTPGLVRRAGISDASSRGGFGRAGDGQEGGRTMAWVRRAKVWITSSAQSHSSERIKISNKGGLMPSSNETITRGR